MRYFLLVFFFVFVAGCSPRDHFDLAEFCQKVKPLTIFGTSACGFCQRAQEELSARGFKQRFVELNPKKESKSAAELIAGNAELQKMLEADGSSLKKLTTVPQIFLGQAHLGGFDDLKAKVLDPIDQSLGASNVARAVAACP